MGVGRKQDGRYILNHTRLWFTRTEQGGQAPSKSIIRDASPPLGVSTKLRGRLFSLRQSARTTTRYSQIRVSFNASFFLRASSMLIPSRFAIAQR